MPHGPYPFRERAMLSVDITLGSVANTAPSILGSALVGAVLRLSPVYLDGPSPISFEVQWLRDGAAISGATAATYTVQDADVGRRISAQVDLPDGSTLFSANELTINGAVRMDPPTLFASAANALTLNLALPVADGGLVLSGYQWQLADETDTAFFTLLASGSIAVGQTSAVVGSLTTGRRIARSRAVYVGGVFGGWSDPSAPVAVLGTISGTPMTVVSDLGPAVTLSHTAPYRVTPDGNIEVQKPATINLTAISTATLSPQARGGAMWAPGASDLAYSMNEAQGFDARGRGYVGNALSYSAGLNKAPEANSGTPFAIPSVGPLVIGVPNPGTVGTTYNAQQTTQTNTAFVVISFVSTLSAADAYRAPICGLTAPKAGWTRTAALARLDTVFPRTRALSGAYYHATRTRRTDRLTRLQYTARSGTWYSAHYSQVLAPDLGVLPYGADFAWDVSSAILDLCETDATIVPQAMREQIMDAVIQIGIDIFGCVRSGKYWQSNGGITHGRWLALYAAAELLDDAEMRACALDPLGTLGASMQPGATKVWLFGEQRRFRPIQPVNFTTGTDPTGTAGDQITPWGPTISSGGNLETQAGFPDSIPFDAVAGSYEWQISSDRNQGGNSLHPGRPYYAVNAKSMAASRVVLEYMRPASPHPQLVVDMMRTLDVMYWDDVSLDKTGAFAVPDRTRFAPDTGAKPNLITNLNRKTADLIPAAVRYAANRPGIAFHPDVTEGPGWFSAAYHPLELNRGQPVIRRDIRWRIGTGTWNTVSSYVDGTQISHGGSNGATVSVQARIVTVNGDGPWSTNAANQAAATNDPTGSSALPRATITLSQAAQSGNTFTTTLAALAADPVFYDSGSARGLDAADIPLAGSTTAPDGAQVQARLVRSDTLAEVQTWATVATAAGGAWSGVFAGAQRSPYRLKVETRVVGSTAAVARSVQDVIVGHIVAIIGQSEDARMFTDTFHNPTYQPLPTFVDAAAEDSVFFLTHKDLVGNATGSGSYAANGLQAVKPSNTKMTRSALHLANVLTRNAPGDRFLIIDGTVSGTSYINLVDDSDDAAPGTRKWKESFADGVSLIRAWGAEPGVVMSTWTANPAAVGDGYRVQHYPIIAGMYLGGSVYAYNAATTGLSPNYVANHGLWDLTGLNRIDKSASGQSGAFLDPAITKFFLYGCHRFEDNQYNTGGLLTTKQDTTMSIRGMIADPALAPIMLPKGPQILLYRNGTPSSDATIGNKVFNVDPTTWRNWDDFSHPSDFSPDGLPARARHTAIAMLYALGRGPAPAASRWVPRFNRAAWEPNGAYLDLWYEAPDGSKPRLSTTRRERGLAAIPTTKATGHSSVADGSALVHRTEVAGFYIGATPAQRVEITANATVGTDVVRVYPNPASAFTYQSIVQFGLGGASGVVSWPSDEFDDIWMNLPLAVLPGFDYSAGAGGFNGIAIEPMPSQAEIGTTLTAPPRFTVNPAVAPNPAIRDTVNITTNGNAGQLTMRAKLKFTANVGETIFSINATNLLVYRQSSGTAVGRLTWTLKDSAGLTLFSGRSNAAGYNAPLNQLIDIVVSIDLDANIAKMFVDGVQIDSVTLAANSGAFAGTRFFEFLSNGDTPTCEVEVLDQWNAYTATGDIPSLGTPRKRITAASNLPVESPSSPAWVRGALA